MFPEQLLAKEHRITRIDDRVHGGQKEDGESGEKDARGANPIFSAIQLLPGHLFIRASNRDRAAS